MPYRLCDCPQITSYSQALRLLTNRYGRELSWMNLGAGTELSGRANGDLVICHEITDLIVYKPDGTFILRDGGYRTKTTKDRLNRFSPVEVFQKNNLWRVGTRKKSFVLPPNHRMVGQFSLNGFRFTLEPDDGGRRYNAQ